MYYKDIKIGEYFCTPHDGNIYRKIEPMHKSSIRYNAVNLTSNSILPLVLMGDSMPVKKSSVGQIKARIGFVDVMKFVSDRLRLF